MNRSQSRMLMLAIAATIVLGFSGVASAWHDGPGYYRGGPALSPEQQAAVEKYQAEHYASTESIRQSLIVKQGELQAAMYGQTPDAQKIEQLSKEIGELKGKLLSAQASFNAQLAREGLPAYSGGYGGGYGYGPCANGGGHGHRGGWGGGHRGGGHRGGGCWW